jgi:hypothetical protein
VRGPRHADHSVAASAAWSLALLPTAVAGGAAQNERGKQERDQRGPATADHRTRKPLREEGTTDPKRVAILASTMTALDVDVPLDPERLLRLSAAVSASGTAEVISAGVASKRNRGSARSPLRLWAGI